MKTEKVGKVLKVELTIEKILPPNLVIAAIGEMYSGGWSNPRLEPYVYITPPVDGIYEFDFVVDVPSGPTTEPVEEVKAEFVWEAFPEDHLKGVRVYAQKNDITAMLQP